MPEQIPITLFGEILLDCFPDGSELIGGAPFNVAWHLKGFNLSPLLISSIGKDDQGVKIRSSMSHWGLDCSCLQSDPTHPTGRVNVSIAKDEASYEIVVDSAFDFIQTPDIRSVPASGILYHGTLALRHRQSAEALASLKTRHRGQIFLDVNLRSPWWSIESVLLLVAEADHVKMNEQELALLTSNGCEVGNRSNLETTMHRFAERHHLETIILTRGAQGALLYRGGEIIETGSTLAKEPIDTVGAGDGFAATMLLGLVKQWSWSVSLKRASEFAASVVMHQGATNSDHSIYSQFLSTWECN